MRVPRTIPVIVLAALLTAITLGPAAVQGTEALRSWHPAGTFTPGADRQGRTVLAKLFTGSECPPARPPTSPTAASWPTTPQTS